MVKKYMPVYIVGHVTVWTGTWHNNNVIMTSKRRRDVVLTL